MYTHLHRRFSELTQRSFQIHFLSVKFDAELLLSCLGNFLGGNRAERSAAGSDLDTDCDRLFGEVIRKRLRFLQLLRLDPSETFTISSFFPRLLTSASNKTFIKYLLLPASVKLFS